ncbi:MAG: hypothetical protein IJW21_06005 [Clostridia bacterium]|nr:hypothetical protein [Clostridia bacterium]
MYDQNTIYLYIRTHEGGLIRREVFRGIASLGEFIDAYKKGDEVFHLYGTNTVVILPKENDTHVKCPVCGVVNEKGRGTCRECGRSVLSDLSFAGGYKITEQKEYVGKEETSAFAPQTVVTAKGVKNEVASSEAKTVYAENETNTLDDYAEARKNAIRARQIREAKALKIQNEEAEHYADYDASIIKKAKEKDEKKDKENFFLEYFSYFGSAVLIIYAVSYIAMVFLGSIFLASEINVFSQTLIFSFILFFRFFIFGKNEFPHKRVDRKTMFRAAVPSWIIYAVVYAIYHGSEVIIPDMFYGGRVPGDGIDALALIFCGLPDRYVTAQPLLLDVVHGWVKPAPLPSFYPVALVISFVLNAAFYTWFAWFAYKFGIDERDMERRDVREGTDVVERIYDRRRFVRCFVPFVNYYQLYSWSYDYLVNPEPDRRLKFYLRGMAIILAGMTVTELLRFLFYYVCKTAWINGLVFYFSLHLVGCIIARGAYYDDKRHRKWMAGYRE